MRQEDRNYERDYNNDYRNQDYGRDRNREREYREGSGMSGQRYDRTYDRGGFDREREMYRDRDFAQNREFNRGPIGRGGSEFDQDLNYNRYGQRNYGGQESRGRYHSTETDHAGRGYQREGNMYRETYYGPEQDRDRGERVDRDLGFREDRNRGFAERRPDYPGGPGYRVASGHRETGPYEDYERDLDRYGIREEYRDHSPQDRYRDYDPDRRPDRDPRELRNFYYRPGEDEERRRRRDYSIENRNQERSPSGNWGPSNPRHPERDRGWRDRY
jgi:hypothetical protein